MKHLTVVVLLTGHPLTIVVEIGLIDSMTVLVLMLRYHVRLGRLV